MILTAPGQAFAQRIEWDGDIPVAYRPDLNPKSSVRIDPDVRFGKPSVKGISTEAIWEQSEVGEDVETLASIYQLDAADIHWALSYENAQRAA